MSPVEAVASVVVGVVVAVATQIVVFPMIGLQALLGQSMRLALVFTAVSIRRSFLLEAAVRGTAVTSSGKIMPSAPALAPDSKMPKHLSLPTGTLLTVLLLSACSPQRSTESGDAQPGSKPRSSTGITTFGDARIGVTF